MNNTSSRIKTILLYLFVVFIAISNVEFIYNWAFSLIICIIEVIVLVFLLFVGRFADYLGYYVLFLCLSFEYSTFVEGREIYNFKNFRFAGINLGLWMLIPLLLYCLLAVFQKRRSLKKKYEKCFLVFVFIQFVSLATSLILIFIFNDNQIGNLRGIGTKYLQEISFFLFFPLIILLSIIMLKNDLSLAKLKRYAILLIFGVCCQTLYSSVFSKFGMYGGLNIIIVSNVYFLFPFIIIIPFFEKKIMPLPLAILVFLCTIILLFYNANGKMVLYLFISMIVIAIKLLSKMKSAVRFFSFFLIVGVSLVLWKLFIDASAYSVLLNNKVNQARQLINIVDENWWDNLAYSPKSRLVEVVSIIDEYSSKPYLSIFGKGFLGSLKDSRGFFFDKIGRGLYTDDEFSISSFYRVHESFNVVLLQNGLFGFVFFLYMSFSGFVRNNKNVFVLIGTLWLFSVYGYSTCITVFGLLLLGIGYAEVDLHPHSNLKKNPE